MPANAAVRIAIALADVRSERLRSVVHDAHRARAVVLQFWRARRASRVDLDETRAEKPAHRSSSL
jgi:hypothetical protein